MFKIRRPTVTFLALLLTTSATQASYQKKEKLIPDVELNNFTKEMEEHYPKLMHPGATLFFAWLDVAIFQAEIDPKKIAVSSYLYNFMKSYSKCVKNIRQKNLVELEENRKNYVNLRNELLQMAAVPLLAKAHINRMDDALGTSCNELQ